MIVTLDTADSVILHNGKRIDVNPVRVFAMAPIGTTIEVIGSEEHLVTLKITIPPDAE